MKNPIITVRLPEYRVDTEPNHAVLGKIVDAELKAVLHQYEGREDKKRDGFVFKDPSNKTEALLGIVKITD